MLMHDTWRTRKAQKSHLQFAANIEQQGTICSDSWPMRQNRSYMIGYPWTKIEMDFLQITNNFIQNAQPRIMNNRTPISVISNKYFWGAQPRNYEIEKKETFSMWYSAFCVEVPNRARKSYLQMNGATFFKDKLSRDVWSLLNYKFSGLWGLPICMPTARRNWFLLNS